jgi:hypothetical protein
MRSDIPVGAGWKGCQKRLAELIATAEKVGLDVSASVTLSEDDQEDIEQIMEFFLQNRSLSFLFLARGISPEALFAPEKKDATLHEQTPKIESTVLMNLLDKKYGLEPFAYIPDRKGLHTNWVSYFIPIQYRQDKYYTFPIRSQWLDLLLMRIQRFLSGRFIHKTSQNAAITFLRTSLNGIATGQFAEMLRFFGRLLQPDTILRHKMIVYDHGPVWATDGKLNYCAYCPTSIVRDGKLFPCCIADYGSKGNSNSCC